MRIKKDAFGVVDMNLKDLIEKRLSARLFLTFFFYFKDVLVSNCNYHQSTNEKQRLVLSLLQTASTCWPTSKQS